MIAGHIKNAAPLLFDRSLYIKNLGKRDFNGLALFYDRIAQELIDRLTLIKGPFEKVTQIGSLGRGDHALCTHFDHSNYCLIDEHKDGVSFSPHGNPMIADAEFLPLASASQDLVLSCLSLHYTNDIVGALKQIQVALKPNSFFQGVILGGDSAQELSACLYKTSYESLGGLSPITPPLLTPQECGYLLSRAGFSLPVVDRMKLTIFYDDPWKILKDIQGLGQACPLYHKGYLGKNFLKKALTLYEETYRTREGLPLTLDLIFLSGFRYHPTHPTALKPGTAKKSLLEALS